MLLTSAPIQIHPPVDIVEYVKREWKGNTDKAELIRKVIYKYIPQTVFVFNRVVLH